MYVGFVYNVSSSLKVSYVVQFARVYNSLSLDGSTSVLPYSSSSTNDGVIPKCINEIIKTPSCELSSTCMQILCRLFTSPSYAPDFRLVVKTPVHFHLIVDGPITQHILSTLFRSWNIPGVEQSFYDVLTVVDDVLWIPNKHYSGIYGLLKLTLPKILPKDLDKIIYWNSPQKLNMKSRQAEFFRKQYQAFLEIDGNLFRHELFHCQNASGFSDRSNEEEYSEDDVCYEFRHAQRIIYRTHLFYTDFFIDTFDHKAFVVPSFETQRYKSTFPRSKSELLNMLDTGQLFIFRQEVWPKGHLATNYDRWRSATTPYAISWNPDFEPYIVVNRTVPLYDVRFAGFGWNKVSHIMELDHAGYDFLVLPNTFAIHLPHAPSFEIVKYRSSSSYRKCLKLLKGEFIKDLAKRYSPDRVKNVLA